LSAANFENPPPTETTEFRHCRPLRSSSWMDHSSLLEIAVTKTQCVEVGQPHFAVKVLEMPWESRTAAPPNPPGHAIAGCFRGRPGLLAFVPPSTSILCNCWLISTICSSKRATPTMFGVTLAMVQVGGADASTSMDFGEFINLALAACFIVTFANFSMASENVCLQ
ncbi:hypothetical protein M758_UG009300, partial [Ceratodon purpureus]